MGTNGIDEAAQAFEAEISTEGAPTPKAKEEQAAAESVFPNLGVPEVDEESPEKGGGDEDPEESIYADSSEESEEGDEGESAEKPDEPDEEDEETPDETLAQKYQITVDGKETEVTVKEALEGYIRTETFHRRLSELGENQQIVQRAAADVVQNFQHAKQMIELMEGQMAQLVPPEPNWDDMFKSDPVRARNLQKYYQQVSDFKAKLQQQKEEASAKMSEHENAQLRTYADQESLRFSRLNQKSWGTDPKKKMKDIQSMRRTALQEGFSEDEIKQVFDSRMLMVLLKASKYDRMIAARPKPIARQVAGKAVTPGPGNKRTGHKGLTTAMKTLARTGNVHDAAPVFDEIIRQRR
jgi:hypothetical protein